MRKTRPIKEWAVFAIVSAILLILDLLLKYWAQTNLATAWYSAAFRTERTLIEGLLGLTYFRNRGAFFGFLGGFEWAQWVLSGFKIIILGGILWYYSRLPLEKKHWLLRVPLILLFAGGAGNLYDRVRYGYVRDMLEFLFMDFAIFNLADVYVTVGAFALIPISIFAYKELPI